MSDIEQHASFFWQQTPGGGDGKSLFQAQVVDAKSGETWLYPRPVYALNRPRDRFLSLSFQRLHWLYRGDWAPCSKLT